MAFALSERSRPSTTSPPGTCTHRLAYPKNEGHRSPTRRPTTDSPDRKLGLAVSAKAPDVWVAGGVVNELVDEGDSAVADHVRQMNGAWGCGIRRERRPGQQRVAQS